MAHIYTTFNHELLLSVTNIFLILLFYQLLCIAFIIFFHSGHKKCYCLGRMNLLKTFIPNDPFFGRIYKYRYCLKENISTNNNTKLKIVSFFYFANCNLKILFKSNLPNYLALMGIFSHNFLFSYNVPLITKFNVFDYILLW